MDYKTALDILRRHNEWRRDNHVPNRYEMVNPTELGKAIDTAIEVLGNLVLFHIESYGDLSNVCTIADYHSRKS